MGCELKTFNVGDKVRVVEAPTYNGSKRFIGEQLVVSKVIGDLEGGNVHFTGFNDCVLGVDLELVEAATPKLSKKRRIEALEKDVARQETELEELRAKIEAFEQKAKSAVWLSDAMRKVTKETSDAISEAMRKATPNQQRARIIADAKDFVEQAIESERGWGDSIIVPDAHADDDPWVCREIKFVVNTEKRTVVALAIGAHTPEVVEKAIAKCAPDDVFNADIGKAIAVGRLFNLDVERFINAPKPTEIVVGHVVQIAHTLNADRVYGVGKITDLGKHEYQYYYDPSSFVSRWNYPNFSTPIGTPSGSKILDDTEAQYEQY